MSFLLLDDSKVTQFLESATKKKKNIKKMFSNIITTLRATVQSLPRFAEFQFIADSGVRIGQQITKKNRLIALELNGLQMTTVPFQDDGSPRLTFAVPVIFNRGAKIEENQDTLLNSLAELEADQQALYSALMENYDLDFRLVSAENFINQEVRNPITKGSGFFQAIRCVYEITIAEDYCTPDAPCDVVAGATICDDGRAGTSADNGNFNSWTTFSDFGLNELISENRHIVFNNRFPEPFELDASSAMHDLQITLSSGFEIQQITFNLVNQQGALDVSVTDAGACDFSNLAPGTYKFGLIVIAISESEPSERIIVIDEVTIS